MGLSNVKLGEFTTDQRLSLSQRLVLNLSIFFWRVLCKLPLQRKTPRNLQAKRKATLAISVPIHAGCNCRGCVMHLNVPVNISCGRFPLSFTSSELPTLWYSQCFFSLQTNPRLCGVSLFYNYTLLWRKRKLSWTENRRFSTMRQRKLFEKPNLSHFFCLKRKQEGLREQCIHRCVQLYPNMFNSKLGLIRSLFKIPFQC